MADGPSKNILNFHGGRHHLANTAREAGRALANARRGVTYANYLKEPGEIIQRADGKSGAPIGEALIVTGFRIDEESWDEPPPRYIQTVQLQVEPGQLQYDPTQRLEFPDTQAIRRFGRLTGQALEVFLEPYNQVDQRVRRLQAWGHSAEEIQRFITAPLPEAPGESPPSASRLLKDAFIAIIKGRIF